MRRDTAAPRFVQVPFHGVRFFVVGGIIWNAVSCFVFLIFVCVPCAVLVLGGSWWLLVLDLSPKGRPKDQKREPTGGKWIQKGSETESDGDQNGPNNRCTKMVTQKCPDPPPARLCFGSHLAIIFSSSIE